MNEIANEQWAAISVLEEEGRNRSSGVRACLELLGIVGGSWEVREQTPWGEVTIT